MLYATMALYLRQTRAFGQCCWDFGLPVLREFLLILLDYLPVLDTLGIPRPRVILEHCTQGLPVGVEGCYQHSILDYFECSK